jgi:hypothetical protein
MEIIKENPDKPWNWHGISMNPNLTMEFIKENSDKLWSWYYISSNPNITMNDIKENPDKPWVWTWITQNIFTLSKQVFIHTEYRRYLASYRIQQWWLRLRLDPRHPVGQKRLEREAEALGFV